MCAGLGVSPGPVRQGGVSGHRREHHQPVRAGHQWAAPRHDLLGFAKMSRASRAATPAASGSPLGFLSFLKASVVTIRDDSAPAIDATGSLLEAGWRRGDSEGRCWAATDNTWHPQRTSSLAGWPGAHRDYASLRLLLPDAMLQCVSDLGVWVLAAPPLADGTTASCSFIVEDAAGNPRAITRTVARLTRIGPKPSLARGRAGKRSR